MMRFSLAMGFRYYKLLGQDYDSQCKDASRNILAAGLVPLGVSYLSEFGQLTLVDLQFVQSVAFWQVACNPHRMASTKARRKKNVHGGTVNTLSNVAATYDEWANANEVAAEDILARLDSVPEEIRDYKHSLADWLTAEAVELRTRAAELRNVDWFRSRN